MRIQNYAPQDGRGLCTTLAIFRRGKNKMGDWRHPFAISPDNRKFSVFFITTNKFSVVDNLMKVVSVSLMLRMPKITLEVPLKVASENICMYICC